MNPNNIPPEEKDRDDIIDMREGSDKAAYDSRQYPPEYRYRRAEPRRRGWGLTAVLGAAFIITLACLAFSLSTGTAVRNATENGVQVIYDNAVAIGNPVYSFTNEIAGDSQFSISTRYESGSADISYTFPASEINKLNIELIGASVAIYPADGDNIIVNWYDTPDDFYDFFTTVQSGGSLNIAEKSRNIFGLSISNLFSKETNDYVYAEIFLPAKLFNQISVLTVSGEISINSEAYSSGFTSERIEISTVSGGIFLTGIVGENTAEITTVSGDITIVEIEETNVVIETTSGNISLRSVYCGDIYISTISGDSYLEELSFKSLKIDTISGNTYLSGLSLSNGFTLKTSVISGEISDFSGLAKSDAGAFIEYNSISGDLDIY